MSSTARRSLRWLLPPLLVGAALVPSVAGADDEPTLRDVRDATSRFHSIEQGLKAGYVDNGLPCFDNPVGGMGEHLVRETAVDGVIDPLAPEALVYEVRADGGYKLVGVEYIAPYDAENRPRLFGRDFDETWIGPDIHLWTLHAWVWREHPLDVLSTWNPAVAPCPA